MTGKDRILAKLRGEPTDSLPLMPITMMFAAELAGVRSEVAYLRGRFDVLIWAVGINAAATIAILGVLLRH